MPSFSLFENILRCEDLLETFGGHAQACGLTVRQENIGDLRERLNRNAVGSASGHEADVRWAEAELLPTELELKLVKDLERLAPFGPGNSAPRFVTRSMRVRGEVKKRGKDTLQCWMTDASGSTTCEVIGFRSFERWQAFSGKQKPVDIIYRPALKNFHGIETLQLELEDWA